MHNLFPLGNISGPPPPTVKLAHIKPEFLFLGLFNLMTSLGCINLDYKISPLLLFYVLLYEK